MSRISYFKCSRCHFSSKNPYQYCPHCQAEDPFVEKSVDDYSGYSHKPTMIRNEPAKSPKIIVDKSLCAGSTCSRCVKVCQPKAMRMQKKATVISEKCTSCLACISRCPNWAIYLTDDLNAAKKLIREAETR
jgi:ferredoxin